VSPRGDQVSRKKEKKTKMRGSKALLNGEGGFWSGTKAIRGVGQKCHGSNLRGGWGDQNNNKESFEVERHVKSSFGPKGQGVSSLTSRVRSQILPDEWRLDRL